MNERKAKKLRQLYRRDMAKRAEENARVVEQQIENFTKELDIILKPAPKLIPEFIWVSLQRLFLNI